MQHTKPDCRDAMQDYRTLRALRGIFILPIFFWHFFFRGEMTEALCRCGVSFFFMLSGLVLSLTYGPKLCDPARRPSYGTFLLKRFAHIYPLYVTGEVLALLLRPWPAAGVIANLMMVQSWIPIETFYGSPNIVNWFVSTLWLGYITFFFLFRFASRSPRLFYACLAAGIALYFSAVILVPPGGVYPVVYVFPPMRLPEFIFGVAMGRLLTCHPGPRPGSTAATLMQLAALAIPVAVGLVFNHIPQRLALASIWWIPNMIILYIAVRTEDAPSTLNCLLHHPLLQGLGNISFVLFLFQMIVIDLWQRGAEALGLDPDNALSSVICLVVAIIISRELHRRLEFPLCARLLSLFRKK